MKGVLYPLISFLLLASALYTDLAGYPEIATLLSGLLISLLIGAFYVGLPLGVLKRRLHLTRSSSVKTLTILLLGGIGATLIGQMLASMPILMISSSITVLSAVSASATLTGLIVSRVGVRNQTRDAQ
jgi:hypothetical protein